MECDLGCCDLPGCDLGRVGLVRDCFASSEEVSVFYLEFDWFDVLLGGLGKLVWLENGEGEEAEGDGGGD